MGPLLEAQRTNTRQSKDSIAIWKAMGEALRPERAIIHGQWLFPSVDGVRFASLAALPSLRSFYLSARLQDALRHSIRTQRTHSMLQKSNAALCHSLCS